MDKRHMKILQKRRMRLLDLDADDHVGDFLMQEGIITQDELEEIALQKTAKGRAKALLGILPRKGRTAFAKFVEALSEADSTVHGELAEMLEKDAIDLGCPVTEATAAPATLPQEPKAAYDGRVAWPVDVHAAQDVELISPAVTMTAIREEGSSGLPDKADQTDNARIYNMSHYPHGLALVINNTKFTCGMRDRVGSDVDARQLKEVFELLGFTTHIVTNASGGQIRDHLYSLAVHNHSGNDAVIIAVLSHGIEGKIYGVDGDLVSIAEITSYYRGDKATTLLGKPKIFFLQACRGGEFDAGVEATDGPPDESGEAPTLSEDELFKKFLDSTKKPGDETDSHLGTLPVEADMVLAYATVPGYVSWRNSERGSWFIQALVKVLREDSRHEHLMDMLVRVNDLVATEFQSKNRNKQMPAPVTHLRKKLFMRPP